jgi:hypothetical protein
MHCNEGDFRNKKTQKDLRFRTTDYIPDHYCGGIVICSIGDLMPKEAIYNTRIEYKYSMLGNLREI